MEKPKPSAAVSSAKERDPKSEDVKKASTTKTENPVEPPVKASLSQPTGDKGNPHYAAELHAAKTETPIKVETAKPTGDKGNPHYAAELNAAKTETAIKAETAQPTGDKGNPHYAAELNAAKTETAIKAETAQPTGDKGNPHYAAELNAPTKSAAQNTGVGKAPSRDKTSQQIEEPIVGISAAQPTGDKGNPHYAAELNALAKEMGKKSTETEGDKTRTKAVTDNVMASVEALVMTSPTLADDKALSSALSSIEADVATSENIKPVIEEVLKAEKSEVTGDKGNPHYAAELDAAKPKEEPIKSTQAPVSGTGAPAAKTSDSAAIKAEKAQPTGDKGNLHYAAELAAAKPKEEPIKSTQVPASKTGAPAPKTSDSAAIKAEKAQPTGDKGNLHYAAELDADKPKEEPIKSTQAPALGTGAPAPKTSDSAAIKAEKAQPTGDKGNLHYAAELPAAKPKEEPIKSTQAPVSGTGAPVAKTSDSAAIKAEKAQPTGDKGNPHYSAELAAAKPKEEPIKSTQAPAAKSTGSDAIKAEQSQPTGGKGNPHYAKQLEGAKKADGADADDAALVAADGWWSWLSRCTLL